MFRYLPLFCAGLACAATPVGALEIASQERYVEAILHEGPYGLYDSPRYLASDRYDAPDLGPFQAQASVGGAAPGCPYPGGSGGVASQDSRIESDQVIASGSLSTNGFSGCTGTDVRSFLRIGFEITEPTPYSIEGSIKLQGLGYARLYLAQGGSGFYPGPFSFYDDPYDSESTPFSQSGLLAPDHYWIVADIYSCGGEVMNCGYGYHDFNFVFTVPEPASGGLAGFGLITIGAIGRRARRPA